MTICFVNGPFLKGFSRESRSPAVTKSGTLYYPAWLAYACGYAEKKGIAAYLFDCVANDLDSEKSIKIIKQKNPILVVLGTSTPSIEADAKFALELKKEIGCKVCLVGTHVSAMAAETLNEYKEIDYIARREYDETIVELYSAIINNKNLIDISGISYRIDGEIKENDDREYISDLDEIPFAAEIYKKHLNNAKSRKLKPISRRI